MKSKKLKAFIKEIQYQNRNPQDNSVLELLNDIVTNPTFELHEGEYLYRARIIEDPKMINKDENFWGYSKEESFVPPPEKTKDMRANYKYIPYLYCSNSPYISVCEVRPRYGAIVSVATIGVNREMQIFDLTRSQKVKGITPAKENLCDDLSEMFSQPITRDDDTLDYIPTQYIAEFIKNLGYSGIMYKSSLDAGIPSFTANHANFVIFNFDRCEAIKSNVYRVNEHVLYCVKDDDDTEALDVQSPVTKADLATSEII